MWEVKPSNTFIQVIYSEFYFFLKKKVKIAGFIVVAYYIWAETEKNQCSLLFVTFISSCFCFNAFLYITLWQQFF